MVMQLRESEMDLIGTEKQTTWAAELRNGAEDQLEEGLHQFFYSASERPAFHEAWREMTAEQTSAAWWIERVGQSTPQAVAELLFGWIEADASRVVRFAPRWKR